MAGTTNRGKIRELEWIYRNRTRPTNFYIALVTDAVAPSVGTKVLGELTEIATGNGYTAGGTQLTPGTTDFDNATEDNTNNLGAVQVRDVVLTASGGSIPASGAGFSYAVLTDDNATLADRDVIRYWDVRNGGVPRTLTDGSVLTFKDYELQNKES